MTTTLASGISYADLSFQGLPRIIATGLLQGPDGLALVDPGPASSLPALECQLQVMGASLADVTALLVTHIHLDHSGAAGTLLARHPHIRVFVHEKGAPHLVDPAKLLASAGRLYGAEMDRRQGRDVPDRAHVRGEGEAGAVQVRRMGAIQAGPQATQLELDLLRALHVGSGDTP